VEKMRLKPESLGFFLLRSKERSYKKKFALDTGEIQDILYFSMKTNFTNLNEPERGEIYF